jgi:hypothetical protein
MCCAGAWCGVSLSAGASMGCSGFAVGVDDMAGLGRCVVMMVPYRRALARPEAVIAGQGRPEPADEKRGA